MTPADYENQQGSLFEQIVGRCYALYQKELRNNQCMDFDDLIMNTIRLFKENEDALQFYQRKFHYIHVDEYQDTNHAQYTLVNLLADRFKIFVSWEMRIKVSMAGGVPICKIFWTSKRLSGCSSDFVGTKLPLNSDDFECCESSHQKQPQPSRQKFVD